MKVRKNGWQTATFVTLTRLIGVSHIPLLFYVPTNNGLVPPVHCITRAVQHLLVCGAVGTLVVPYWPSNVFWPFLFANAIQFQPYVLAYIHFPDPSGIFALGSYKYSLNGSDRFITARSWQSELALRGPSSFKPSGFMLAHVFFVPLLSSFVLVSHETSSPSGLFTFVFKLAHMALNSFASRQRHYQASIFYCCIDSRCV